MPKKLSFTKVKSSLSESEVAFFYGSIRKNAIQTAQTVNCTECKRFCNNNYYSCYNIINEFVLKLKFNFCSMFLFGI